MLCQVFFSLFCLLLYAIQLILRICLKDVSQLRTSSGNNAIFVFLKDSLMFVPSRCPTSARTLLQHLNKRYSLSHIRALSDTNSVNDEEIKKFSAVGKDWWSAESNRGTGPLHSMNPVRVAFIRRTLAQELLVNNISPNLQMQGLDILDVGCGGGILSESLARLGANVTSIDPSDVNIGIARRHSSADPSTSTIDYCQMTIEEMAKTGRQFDVVCSLEVIEHVETPMAFVAACGSLVKKGGSLYLSTINRNLKSFGVAIVGAEYVMNMLPHGTHDWNKFITPDELTIMVETGNSGLTVCKTEGLVMSMNLMNQNFMWRCDPDDLEMNYILHAIKNKTT